MRLREGVHARDIQITELRRLAYQLGITEAGERVTCEPYGASRWCELEIDDADAVIHSLRGALLADLDSGGELRRAEGRFWSDEAKGFSAAELERWRAEMMEEV